MRQNKNIKLPKHKVFAFVVDGECELWYLQKLKENERLLKISLEPKIPQKKKTKDQYQKVLELASDCDKVFWIIDFDVIVAETRVAKKGVKTPLQEFKELYTEITKYENVTVIINNPCFEYWLLLHFEETSKYYDSYDKLLKPLKKYLPDYEKTQKYYKNQSKDIYSRLKPNLKQAIGNANKLGKFNFDNTQTGMSEMQFFFNEAGIKENIELK